MAETRRVGWGRVWKHVKSVRQLAEMRRISTLKIYSNSYFAKHSISSGASTTPSRVVASILSPPARIWRGWARSAGYSPRRLRGSAGRCLCSRPPRSQSPSSTCAQRESSAAAATKTLLEGRGQRSGGKKSSKRGMGGGRPTSGRFCSPRRRRARPRCGAPRAYAGTAYTSGRRLGPDHTRTGAGEGWVNARVAELGGGVEALLDGHAARLGVPLVVIQLGPGGGTFCVSELPSLG